MVRLLACTLTLVFLASAMLDVTAGDPSPEAPFDYFRNSWNVIGLRDYRDGTRVTPDNQLLLSEGRRAQIRFGRQLVPLGRQPIKTLQDGWLPMIQLSVEDAPVRYEILLWATPLPSAADWQAAFDGPVETENFLNWVTVRVTNTGTEPAGAKFQVDVSGEPPVPGETFQWQLGAGQTAEAAVRIPFAPLDTPEAFAGESAERWRRRTEEYWQELILDAARIEVPCRKSTEALRAAHVCQLIANDHGELQGGEGFYDEFYIRDGGYQLMELEEAGLWDAARKAVGHYLRCQRPDGRFETQTNQFDANGQALWVLWQYFQITGDRQWLAEALPAMIRSAEWIVQARRQTPEDSPFAGLLPAAPADGEYLWDGRHHIVGYDLWNLRGLLCTAEAAGALGRADEAERFRDEARLYREAIDRAGRRSGVEHFPPSWELDGTHWGNTETLWPTPIFSADDPRVAATIHHARHEHGGGFIEGTIQWLGRSPAIHPYMSAYTTMASLRRGEHAQVVEDFYWYLLHSSASHAFPEGIFQTRRFAWSNTLPHVTGASNFALMLRHMLIDERGDQLHLLAAVPDWWLEDGRQIEVRRAPTHFGELDLIIRGVAAGVTVDFVPPGRKAPRRIVLYLPRSRPLVGDLPGVEVVLRDDQPQRWDWPTVIERYRESAGPAARPIPGLVAWPLAQPPEPGRCETIPLDDVVNTDPWTAPFGVQNPGKFLFTGLKSGKQTVYGVPFEVLDPGEHGAHALVVLHSPRGPAHLVWPHEVRIPIGKKGTRLFLLGNVHGWNSHDPGTGEWGAVAEYEIVYADGTRQHVPLITGRTIDEWAATPEADEVQVALQGEPWHLNLLGVELRDAEIKELVFRDLDTPAAPVLAAVTLERSP